MSDCNICGKNIPVHEGVFRLMKTGKYSDGRDYFRNVNLCLKCDTDQTDKKQTWRVQKTVLIIGASVAVITSTAYLLFVR